MALTLLTEPTPTSPPSSANDWGYLNTKATALVQAFTGRNPVVGSTIKAGTVIPVGGALYKAMVDESITGTASIYVKITPAGSAATASFVSSLSGVSWNHVYGQYLDGSGNAYLFDEARAINEGVLSTAYTMQGQIAYIKGGLNVSGPVIGAVNLPLIPTGSLSANRNWYPITGSGTSASWDPDGKKWAYFITLNSGSFGVADTTSTGLVDLYFNTGPFSGFRWSLD